jgi:hypothetical protein
VVEIPDLTDPSELQAIYDFTYPCFYCVPGARESWHSLPIVFEDKAERDPQTDWANAAVVTRNEPSSSHPGLIQVVGRTGDGREVIVDHAAPSRYIIGELVALDDDNADRRDDVIASVG